MIDLNRPLNGTILAVFVYVYTALLCTLIHASVHHAPFDDATELRMPLSSPLVAELE